MKMRRLLRSRASLVAALLADVLLYAGAHGPYDYSATSFEAAMALQEQVTDAWHGVSQLAQDSEIVHGGKHDFEVLGADREEGAFFPSTLLYCDSRHQ